MNCENCELTQMNQCDFGNELKQPNSFKFSPIIVLSHQHNEIWESRENQSLSSLQGNKLQAVNGRSSLRHLFDSWSNCEVCEIQIYIAMSRTVTAAKGWR